VREFHLSVTDLERIYAICAERGIEAVLEEVGPTADFAGLTEACLAGARDADKSGDQLKAERLRSASQYLIYLQFPYD
jgi:hypothetical protein